MTTFKKVFPILLGVLLVGLAPVWYFAIAPQFSKLSPTYSYELKQSGWTNVFDSDGTVEQVLENLVRNDEVVEVNPDIVVINSTYEGFDTDGNTIFGGEQSYAVDRHTRENVAHGDIQDREGQFSFSPFVEKRNYLFHSPEIIEAPADAQFVGLENLFGDEFYKFSYSIPPVDKSEFFPVKDELARSGQRIEGDHSGYLWVEPVSGRIVKYEHRGSNVIVDSQSSEKVTDFQDWFNSTTENAVRANIDEAFVLKRYYVIMYTVVPAATLVLGAILVGVQLIRLARRRRA